VDWGNFLVAGMVLARAGRGTPPTGDSVLSLLGGVFDAWLFLTR
jgi:hypothetical protein